MLDSRKKDINWINAVKAICMISVYFVHSQLYYGLWMGKLNNLIHPFYVNAFFFISGYLLFGKQLSSSIVNLNLNAYIDRGGAGRKLLSNIFFRVIVPSILFSILEFLPKKIIRGENLNFSSFIWETFGGGTYWFTSALVVAELIILFLLMTRFRSVWCYIIVSIAIFYLANNLVKIETKALDNKFDFWYYKQGLLAVPLLALGGGYKIYESLIHRFMNPYVLICMSAIYLLYFYFCGDNIPVLVSVLNIDFIGLFSAIYISVILIELAKYLPKISYLTFIGQKSLAFYFMSGALPLLFSMLLKNFFSFPSFFGLIVVFILSLQVAYVITYLLDKFTPWLFDIRIMLKKNNKSIS